MIFLAFSDRECCSEEPQKTLHEPSLINQYLLHLPRCFFLFVFEFGVFSKHEQRRYAASHVAGAQVVCSKFTDTVFQLWDEGLGNLRLFHAGWSRVEPQGFPGLPTDLEKRLMWHKSSISFWVWFSCFAFCSWGPAYTYTIYIYMMTVYLVIHISR